MDEYGPYMDASTNEDTEWRICTAIVRLEPGTVESDGSFPSGGGPYIHANEYHTAVGVTSVKVNASGNLELTKDGEGPIAAVLVSPDETLSARRIFAGASGGLGTTTIWMAKGGADDRRLYLNVQADWDEVAGVANNLWIAWLSPRTRGVGDPSKADQALALCADLDARVSALEG